MPRGSRNKGYTSKVSKVRSSLLFKYLSLLKFHSTTDELWILIFYSRYNKIKAAHIRGRKKYITFYEGFADGRPPFIRPGDFRRVFNAVMKASYLYWRRGRAEWNALFKFSYNTVASPCGVKLDVSEVTTYECAPRGVPKNKPINGF